MTFEEFVGTFYKPQWVKDYVREAWMYGYREGYEQGRKDEAQGVEIPARPLSEVPTLEEALKQKEEQRLASQNQKGNLA